MAVKKKATKSSPKTKAKKVVAKGRSSTNKKSTAKKSATKLKASKGKKAAIPKKSKAKSTTSPSSAKKVKSASSLKNKKPASTPQSKKKKTVTSKQKATRKVAPTRTPVAKKASKPKRAQPAKTKTSSKGLNQLSPSERYNVGGLCACVIETFTKEGQGRLQRVVTHLGLSELEQANLVRVSQGLRIPKLFADGLAGEEMRLGVLKGLSQFAKADDPSGKRWKTDLEDFARLLGA